LRSQIGNRRDRYRAEKRDVAAEVPLQDVDTGDSRNEKLAGSYSSPSEQMVRKEEIHVLERALSELRESDRDLIELRQKEGCEFAEIARRLNISEEAAQKRWVRALQALKEKVDRLQ
jgi:RNA polymerase sigma-70 factor (ECF subfamily)